MAAEEARWLDEQERRVWLTWMFGTRLFWEEIERDLQREADMSFGYYDILVMLSNQPGRMLRMSDLADATQSSRSRLSHAVARLEARGWVRREQFPGDRRGQMAVVTDEGFAALEAAAPHHVESVRTHFFDQLSPDDQEQLRAICERLMDHLLPLAEKRGDVRTRMIAQAIARLDGRPCADDTGEQR
jgi:DNA-binding MarR family transcriptional regulator